MTVFKKVTCKHCGKVLDFPIHQEDPRVIIQLKAYRFGWTFYKEEWHCQDCRPKELKFDPAMHPYYSNYEDSWGHPKEKLSHHFTEEKYDRYADILQPKLCELCDHCHINYEDYGGGRWLTCHVEDDAKHSKHNLGHNLYSGHFYGAAISGRFCPYFSCEYWIIPIRDPEEDVKNGTFHVPYNECYDGD